MRGYVLVGFNEWLRRASRHGNVRYRHGLGTGEGFLSNASREWLLSRHRQALKRVYQSGSLFTHDHVDMPRLYRDMPMQKSRNAYNANKQAQLEKLCESYELVHKEQAISLKQFKQGLSYATRVTRTKEVLQAECDKIAVEPPYPDFKGMIQCKIQRYWKLNGSKKQPKSYKDEEWLIRNPRAKLVVINSYPNAFAICNGVKPKEVTK